jgi:beta-glucosidase
MAMIPYAVPYTYPEQARDKPHHTFLEFITYLKQLVHEGKVPMDRIDDAVRRILLAKYQFGLFGGRKGSPSLLVAIGSPAHRAVARDCVRKSLVLLQNRNRVLPLSKHAQRIGVTGKGANNLNVQCGGWTIDWQSMNGMQLTGATSILDAVRATVSSQTKVIYSRDGRGLEGCDVVLAVVGENPYAEYKGDRKDLSLDASDRNVIANARKSGAPLVTVLISGRPLLIDSLLKKSDGVIAAWLPGSEGRGVTDVLFGDCKPTGKLPLTWPRTMAQIPTNGGPDVQFPFGFGLTYE